MTNTIKPFSEPSYTQFSNDALDYVMRAVPANTWKIICVAIRKTYGWHKQSDIISLSQFMEYSGIKSRSTLVSAINDALERGILLREQRGNSYEYQLNRNYTVQKLYWSKNCTDASLKTVPILPPNGTETVHTKESIKEKEINGDYDFFANLAEEEIIEPTDAKKRRQLSDAFYTLSKIPQPNPGSRGYTDWMDGIDRLIKIESTVDEMMAAKIILDEAGYTYNSPGSFVRTIVNMRKTNKGKNEPGHLRML